MKSKYFLFTIILVTVFYSASAQRTIKKFYVDGNFSFSRIKSTTEYSIGDGIEYKNSLSVSPGFGYLISDRFIVGAGVSYDQSKISEISNRINPYLPPANLQSSEMLKVDLSPYIYAKYIYPIHEKVNIGVSIRLKYGMQGSKLLSLDGTSLNSDSSYITYNTQYFACSVSPELQFMLTKSIGLQGSFDLFNIQRDTQAYFGNENSVLQFDFSLNPSTWKFGIFLYFGRKE